MLLISLRAASLLGGAFCREGNQPLPLHVPGHAHSIFLSFLGLFTDPSLMCPEDGAWYHLVLCGPDMNEVFG